MRTSLRIILTMLLPVMVTMAASSQDAGETVAVKGLNYRLTTDSEGRLTAEVIGGQAAEETLSIGASLEYDGKTYAVSSIGDEAFRGSSAITLDLSQASSLERIGASAFAECKRLQTVTLPTLAESSLTTIGPLAFHHDTALRRINLEDSRIAVLEALFTEDSNDEAYFDNLTELQLPITLKEIKDYALQFLGIQKIAIPAGVTAIGEGILEGNIYLEEFIWEDAQVTSLPRNTFLGDDALRKVSILSVKPLDADGLTDMHFYMCHKERLTVWVTAETYAVLTSAGYTNEASVFSTLAADTGQTSSISSSPVSHTLGRYIQCRVTV